MAKGKKKTAHRHMRALKLLLRYGICYINSQAIRQGKQLAGHDHGVGIYILPTESLDLFSMMYYYPHANLYYD